MAVQKLVLDTLDDESYELIAIHCSLAPYRIAFLLNKYLGLRLIRKKEDIFFQYSDLLASFPLYQYNDQPGYCNYHLLGNTYKTNIAADTRISGGLFAQNEDSYVTKYLIPECKNVDYFLKIETERSDFSSKNILTSLLNISQFITAYVVASAQLKSKNNLILE